MKLLRIISSINPALGGTMEAARLIDAELLRVGHKVDLLCLDDPNESYLDMYPASVHAIGPSVGFYHYNKNLVYWLRKNACQYDAVIVDGLWQYPTFAVWRALSNSKVPYYVYVHGMLSPWFKEFYPKKHFKKSLYWLFIESKVLRDAKGVFFTSEEEKSLAPLSFSPYRCNSIVTSLGAELPPIENKDALERFFVKYPEVRGKRVVLFLGRIHQVKGCDILVQAFAKTIQNIQNTQNIHLVIAGPDQYGLVDGLKEMSNQLGVSDKITWTGMLSGEMKWAAFYAAEVLILPSHQESFGIAVAEAVGCGRPVLISNKVSIWREIEADNAGWVAEDTVAGCQTLLEQWIATSSENMSLKNQMALNCFNKRFRIQSAAESFISKITQG